MDRRAAALPVLLAVLAGCGGGGTTQTQTQARTSTPGSRTASPSATPTALPVHVQNRAGGGRLPTITETKHGRKVFTIVSISTDARQSGGGDAVATLERPHVIFYDVRGRTTIADAPQAVYRERTKTVVMQGGVQARTSDGNVLTCDELRYNAGTERIHGEGHVVTHFKGGLSLAGDHLDGDVRLQDVRVTKGSP